MGLMNTAIFAELENSYKRIRNLEAIHKGINALLRKFNVWNMI